MAGRLSEGGAQLLRGTVVVGDEARFAAQPLHQPLGTDLAGLDVAWKMHAADHALPREMGSALQELLAARGQHVGQ